jgi:hypothetical protein
MAAKADPRGTTEKQLQIVSHTSASEERAMSNRTLERMRPRRGFAITVGVLGAILLTPALGSCGPTGRGRYLRGPAPAAKPAALHAVQNKRLHEILQGFESGPPPDPQELPAARERCARELAEAASAMAVSTRSIPDAMGDIDLGESNRETFLGLSNKLCQQAVNVSKQAQQQAFSAVHSSLEEMQTTCRACHSLFSPKRPGA